ncbi:MAG: PilZ domain-containing protein [Candidatus Omnitrophica bacterium]|nr:PilZ domain-containing protein [Candidatus Omnitrophota bacterium]MCM8832022.1 PilZ domain-containing protein [Candidatus Omnitrophota bacterium]
MPERRRFVRFSAPFTVRLKVSEEAVDTPAIVENISFGGAKIFVSKSLQLSPSSYIKIFLLFSQVTLSINGRVVWVKEYDDKKELGVCFINMPDSYKEEIFNHVFKYYPSEISKKWWQM